MNWKTLAWPAHSRYGGYAYQLMASVRHTTASRGNPPRANPIRVEPLRTGGIVAIAGQGEISFGYAEPGEDAFLLPVQLGRFFPMFIEKRQFFLGLLDIGLDLAYAVCIAVSGRVCQRSVQVLER